MQNARDMPLRAFTSSFSDVVRIVRGVYKILGDFLYLILIKMRVIRWNSWSLAATCIEENLFIFLEFFLEANQ